VDPEPNSLGAAIDLEHLAHDPERRVGYQVQQSTGDVVGSSATGIVNQWAVVRRAERRPSTLPLEGGPQSSCTEAMGAS
jgi:hypothetical protein